MNVLHFIHDSPVTQATLATCSQRVSDSWCQHFTQQLTCNGYAYFRWRSIFLGDNGIPAGEYSLVRGGANGNGMPPQVALRMRFLVAATHQRASGRYFHAAPPVGHVTDGLLSVAGVAAAGAVVAAIKPKWLVANETSVTGFRLVVKHKATNDYHEVTDIVFDNTFSTVRTRRLGIGY